MVARSVRMGTLMLFGVMVSSSWLVATTASHEEQAEPLEGLRITPSGVTRAKRVSLQDCPPGENIVRGVIRPNEENEFVSVSIDVEVLPSFSPAPIEKPLLFDDSDNEYKTAQSFRDVNTEASFSCQFSFRVPTGTEITRVEIAGTSFDLTALDP